MSQFEEAITWRGPDKLCFIAYGIWRPNEVESVLQGAAKSMAEIANGLKVEPFVATDDDWPCDVGVFDVEMSYWPRDVATFCNRVLVELCSCGATSSWMMFDGVFNEISDIFSGGWAASIYAVMGDCSIESFDCAISDSTRNSSEWAQLIVTHRERVLSLFPEIAGK